MAIKWKSDSDLLEEMKKSKSEEMSRICGERIIGGFEYEVRGIKYWFTYSNNDQINLQEANKMFEEGKLDWLMWSTRLNGGKVRIPLEMEVFMELYTKSIEHKFSKVAKYNDVLIPMILKAKTIEEVKAISWDSAEDVQILKESV